MMIDWFDKIESWAREDGMPNKLSTLIAAQAAHETGNFTSNVFKEDNNAFGYKSYPGAYWQLKRGLKSPEGDSYANYASVRDSLHEVVGWINRRVKEGRFPNLIDILTPEMYANSLKKCGYYGDSISNYTNGLERAMKHYSGK